MTAAAKARGLAKPPVRRLEVDLDHGWPKVAGSAQGPSPAGGIQLVARLHGCPVGLVVAPLPEAGFTPRQLEKLVAPAIAEAVQAHRWRDEQPLDAGLFGTAVAPSARPRCERVRRALDDSGPPLDVVIPTRNRPDRLAECVDSILASGYRRVRVIVVDNDPSGPETADLVAGRADWGSRVSYVWERCAGSSRARNRGIEHATAEIVAFVDDDVVVDSGWAAGLVAAFLEEPEAGCVTGPIIAAELNTRAQMWIEEYGGFSKGFVRRVFDPFDSPAEVPLFPYAAGTYGSGANMAFRRETIIDVHGFDPALGIGTAARGGEDLAAFAGALLSGEAPGVRAQHDGQAPPPPGLREAAPCHPGLRSRAGRLPGEDRLRPPVDADGGRPANPAWSGLLALAGIPEERPQVGRVSARADSPRAGRPGLGPFRLWPG